MKPHEHSSCILAVLPVQSVTTAVSAYGATWHMSIAHFLRMVLLILVYFMSEKN